MENQLQTNNENLAIEETITNSEAAGQTTEINQTIASLEAILVEIGKYRDEAIAVKTEIETVKKDSNLSLNQVQKIGTSSELILVDLKKKYEEIAATYTNIQAEQTKSINYLKESSESAKSAAEFLDQTFNSLKTKIVDPDSGLDFQYNKAKSLLGQIEKDKTDADGIKNQINIFKVSTEKLLEDLDKKSSEIKNLHSDFFIKDEFTNENKRDVINAFYKQISEYSENLKRIQANIEAFEKSIFNTEIGLKKKLEEFDRAVIAGNQLRIEQFDALFKKIEGLLPGATSAGLAKAYQEQTQSYKLPYIIWATIFCCTMIAMAVYAAYHIPETSSLSEAFIKLLSKLPFLVPTIWLAIFSSKQQSQYKRLQQEYAHKANVAKTYEGHKRQIESMPDTTEKDQLSAKLLSALVDNVSNNPSDSLKDLSHNDSPPLLSTVFDKMLSKKDTEAK